jgi:hypothetical protein
MEHITQMLSTWLTWATQLKIESNRICDYLNLSSIVPRPIETQHGPSVQDIQTYKQWGSW